MTMNQGQSVTLCIIVMCAAASSSAFMATNPRGFNRRYQTKSYTKSRHRNFSESLFQQEMTEQPSKSPKAEETIKSLRRLLERQQADMEMTKDILNSIEQAKLSEGKDEKQHKSLSASLLNGFDYGFVSRSEGGTYSEIKGDLPAYAPPGNVWKLGWGQFFRNLEAMKGEYREEVDVNLTSGQVKLREKLDSLTLDSRAIWQREEKTEVQAPIVVKVPYLLLCWLLDVLFEGQYVFSRFFLLETVARMPYFSYISMIHLYETLGFWRRSTDAKRIHFAEELNEFRHLLIAESLGGDQECRQLETHAVNTYGQFLDENEATLKELPPPLAAVEYYSFGASDPFYAEFQIGAVLNDEEIRRPGRSMQSLYDVYCAIQADEADHVSAMEACLDPNVALVSPSIEKRVLTAAALITALGLAVSGGGGLDFGMDGTSLESAASDGSLETTAASLGALASQLMGGSLLDNFGANDGAVEGSEFLAESLTVEKALSSVLGGLAAVLGLSNISQRRKEEIRDEDNSVDKDDDLS